MYILLTTVLPTLKVPHWSLCNISGFSALSAFSTLHDFTMIGPKLSNKIQNLGQHFSTFMPPKSDKSFYLSPTTPTEVALEIKSLSDSTSSDILIKLIKSASRHISKIYSATYLIIRLKLGTTLKNFNLLRLHLHIK